MEILIAIAAKIAEYTVKPIGQWLCYSFHYSSNIGSMKKQVEKLRLARDTMQHSIDTAIRNGEAIEGVVNNWLKEVDEITELAMKVVEVEEEAKTRRSNATACLDLKLRHQLSHKAKKIAQAMDKVLENCKFDRVSYRPAPQGIVTTRSTDYVDSNSRKSTMTRLIEALRDDKIQLIGVWGMAGVGKSTLVREVAKEAMKKQLSDEVAIANVTQSPDLRRIQGEIADMLDLKFDVESTVIGRAILLRQRLTGTEEKKKILVILDDIWQNLDLEAIGIPYEGCKVLLTSRNRDILVCKMGTQKDFGLEVLSEKDAWSLFEKMAGDCVNKDPNLQFTATEVAKVCSGLPLALVTVSKALRDKELFEWKDALQLLRRPTLEHLNEMQSTIHSSIKLSYKHLKESNKEALQVFLLCAQLGYYFVKTDLLKYCYGLGLFHGIDTMEDARNRLYTTLRILKDCCLLLQSPYSSERVHMHDVVRDAAKLIASHDHNMFVVRVAGGQIEWPDANALKRCETFVALGVDIQELPKEIECPELRFFYLRSEDCPLQISDTFFRCMGKLKVLDLTKLRLSSLPSSLHFLENLQTLCLVQCVLGDIAVIGELKNLTVLSLIHSEISQLPREMGLLSCLRLLDLSNCSKLEVIPPNVLSSLVALEELYMGNSFVKWEAEGLNNERNNASIAELKHLSHLITLEIQIPNASILPKDLLSEKLQRYVITIGDEWDWTNGGGEVSRTLKLKLNTSFQSQVGIKMILNKTENLYLDELKGVKSVLHELDWEGFQQLKHLHIQNNPEIKYITNLMMSIVVFSALETFHLKNMTSLEEICRGQLPNLTSFGNLRVVKVEHCDKLKYFFSSSIARGLSRLEELEIRECSIMGAIVMKEESEIEDEYIASLFPQLRRLVLKHLPKLMSFLSTQNSLITNAGEIIMEGKPVFDTPILDEQVVFPNLKRLELSSIGLEGIQGNQRQASRSSSSRLGNMQSKSRFQNLLHLVVKGSNNMKYLLSLSTARYMGQLKYLRILECEVMEEILVTEDLVVVEETISEMFPRLESLYLKGLPMLKRFCQGSNIKFPSLKHLWIEKCPNLKTFISKPVSLDMTTSYREPKEMNAAESPHTAMQPLFNEEVAFPCLTYLGIFHMDNLKVIWGNQFTVDSFCKLQVIKVFSCENLLNVVQSDMLARFQSLEELTVSDCGSLQEVIEVQPINVKETQVVTSKDPKPIFSFQNLQRVRVALCRSLKSFFPVSVFTCLPQLEQLVIINCEALEEIVAGEEAAQPIAKFVFPRLTFLHLGKLPRLKWFYPGVYTLEWPMLKNMLVAECPNVEILAYELSSFQDIVGESQVEIPIKQPLFLVDEVVFPNLERLVLSSIGLEDIQHNQNLATRSSCILENMQSTQRFQNLLDLVVEGSNNIKYLLSFSTARVMVQLKNLRILECEVLEEILVTADLGVVKETIPKVLFPLLESLCLKDLPILKRFCEGSNIKFPSLKHLTIDKCPNLKTFISKPVSLDMTTSCKELKEMNVAESPQTAMQPLFNEEVVFPNLERLELSSIGLEDVHANQRQASTSSSYRLGNMQSKSRYQNLLHLEVKGSNNIKYLLSFSTAKYMVQLKNLWILECEVMEEILVTEDLGVVEEETTPNVLFPLLESLFLKDLPILKRFCEGSNIKFPSLKDLIINNCPNLKTFISKLVSLDMTTSYKELKEMNAAESPHAAMEPLFNEEVAFPCLAYLGIFHMDNLKVIWQNQFAVDSFYKLQVIMVLSCENVVNIFQSDMLARFQNLEELMVDDCGSLQEVFELQGINVKEMHVVTSKDPKPIFSFQNLRRVGVSQCRSLKSLFPASVATCLTQLEKLVIFDCMVLKEIVAGEGAEQPIAKFVFPRVTVLHLGHLPRLKWFYPGVHTSEWPELKNVLVVDCGEAEIFASGLSSFQYILGQIQVEIPNKQPLFLVDDEVPFPSLEKLRIICMANLKIIWHNQFTTYSFCEPQAMKVEFCENLIDHQETCSVTTTQLKELHLLHLPKLKHIWNKDPQVIFSFQNPREVHDMVCERTESPFPGADQEDIPVIWMLELDNHRMVKEIGLRYQNSGVSPMERIIEIDNC